MFVRHNLECLNKIAQIVVIAMFLLLVACKHKQKEIKTVSKPKTKPTQKTTQVANSELAKKLGISDKEVKSNKLYSFINDWYGAPYKYGGCQKNGVDCSCFVSILNEQVYNKNVPRTADEMFKQCKKISLNEAKTGDFVFFKINGNTVSHVGVVLIKNNFAHSSTSKGVIVNNIDEAYYKKYFFCAGRIN